MSLERIADAAVGIADTESLAAVSMQRVASELGFTKMALYRYLPGKNDLVALMVERAIGAAPDLAGKSWRAGLRMWAHALLTAHLRHPWTLEAVLLPRSLGPNELSWMDAGLALLTNTCLSGAERLDTLAVLTGQVRIIAQQARSAAHEEHFLAAIGAGLADDGDRFPALASTMAELAVDSARDQAFAFGLDRILDGLDKLIKDRTRQDVQQNPDRVR